MVTMRSGVVMSRRGGVLARLLPPFRLGLGARLGSGTQVMSWITLADYAAIVSFLLAHPEITGPVNLTTPYPVTNAEFTSALAAAVHRPGVLFLPEQALKLAIGECQQRHARQRAGDAPAAGGSGICGSSSPTCPRPGGGAGRPPGPLRQAVIAAIRPPGRPGRG